jgi:tetratricopeptide (TPR) repeat protein
MPDHAEAEAARLVAEGSTHLEREEYGPAADLYRAALALVPAHAGGWHDLGIATKHLRLWEECRAANRRALALEPEDEGAAWNLGIAGTALEDWTAAREGWRAAAIEIPPGEGPPEMDLGPVPVRVAVDTSPEVVWCKRIDPARAIVQSIPTPQCERRYGDLVLHDGSAVGERLLDGRRVPVFNELALLAPSSWSTYQLEVEAGSPGDIAALEAILDAAGLPSEDWTASIRQLCRACSEGNPDTGEHRHEPETEWSARRRVGVASERSEAELRALVETWLGARDRTLLGRWVRPPVRKLLSLGALIRGAPRP